MTDDVKKKKGGFINWLRGGKRKEEKEPTEAKTETPDNGDASNTVDATIEDLVPSEAQQSDAAPIETSQTTKEATPAPIQDAVETPSGGLFQRLKSGLSQTRANLSDGIANLFLGKKAIDDDLLEELETQLLLADVGIDATTEIIDQLTKQIERKKLKDADALHQALLQQLSDLIKPVAQPLDIPEQTETFVILVVGVNGVGKTTTIGKLAKKLQANGKSVMLAAGDTFRAAATEQLQVWGERNDVPVIAQHEGADSASVIFDALQAAQARNIDVLIADTAGRLHTKSNLMDELTKVKRVMKKLDTSAPHETLLVLDASTGQNALSQTEQFHEAAGLSGIALTKLDGTAKGGIVFALAQKFALPIRFIGVGEGIDDLRPFDADDFSRALFSSHSEA